MQIKQSLMQKYPFKFLHLLWRTFTQYLEAQISLIVAFTSIALSGLMFSIFILTIVHMAPQASQAHWNYGK